MVPAQKGRRGWDKLMKTGLSLGRVVRASPKRFEKRSELCGACQKSRKENSAGKGHSAGKGLEAGKSWARQENETQGLEEMQGGGVGIWHKMQVARQPGPEHVDQAGHQRLGFLSQEWSLGLTSTFCCIKYKWSTKTYWKSCSIFHNNLNGKRIWRRIDVKV